MSNEAPTQIEKGPSIVTVINNEPRLTPFYSKDYKATQIDYKRGPVSGNGVFYLHSGMNEVPVNVWEQMKRHPVFKFLIEEGKVEEFKPTVTEKVEGKDVTTVVNVANLEDLSKLSNKDALKLIENTMDGGKLSAWKKSLDPQKRRTLVEAIDVQIQKLFTGDKK